MRLMRWLAVVTATVAVFGVCLWLFRFASWSWMPHATQDRWAVAAAFATVTAGAVGVAGAWWAGRETPEQGNLSEAMLEVTQVSFTHDAEFDVMVRNLGDTDIIIHRISVKKLHPPIAFVAPILKPTAKYHILVDRIPVGVTESISISHVVPARSADRFLIALHTTTVYELKVTLHYNRDQEVSFTRTTWDFG
jgi:hypothetical protein